MVPGDLERFEGSCPSRSFPLTYFLSKDGKRFSLGLKWALHFPSMKRFQVSIALEILPFHSGLPRLRLRHHVSLQ